MVKVTVIKPFKDLTHNVMRRPGDTFEVDERRFKSLTGANAWQVAFVEAVEPEETKHEDMTVQELKLLLDEKGIEYDSKAKKADLIRLLG